MLFAAHSGLRFLVLVGGLFVILYAAVGFFGKREYSSAMARLVSVFTGLIHLQVLVGFAALFVRPFSTILIGHIFLMIAAAVGGPVHGLGGEAAAAGGAELRPPPGRREPGHGVHRARDHGDRAGGAAEHGVAVRELPNAGGAPRCCEAPRRVVVRMPWLASRSAR